VPPIADGAVYVPEAGAVAADEDGFTLAATALEALGSDRLDRATSVTLVALGDLPSTAAEDLARFLGVEAVASDAERPSSSIAEALERADVDGTRPALVVAVQIRSRDPTRALPDASGPPDVAIALWLERAGSFRPDLPRSNGPPDEIGRLIEAARRAAVPWPGLAEAPTRSGASPRATETPLIPDQPVAQGAYVPWPRYTEATPAHWRLAADRCGECGALTFPPRSRCRACGSVQSLAKVRLDPDGGVVAARTVIGPGGQPTEFDPQVTDRGPYGVVLVEFEGGVRATMQVAGTPGPGLDIGSGVTSRLRRLYPMEGRWRYGRKALPRRVPASR
jgi:hydroxymethylglutaryl-CoA synthase